MVSSKRLQDKSSKHLEDMSSRRLQDMSSKRLQDVFSVTIFRLPRRLQDVLEDVNCYTEDALKTSSRHVLEDIFKTNKCLLRWLFKRMPLSVSIIKLKKNR